MKKNKIDVIMDKISGALEERKVKERRKADNDENYEQSLERRERRERRNREKTPEKNHF